MRHVAVSPFLVLALLGLVAPAQGACSPDSVAVGPTCVDKHEASVWKIPIPLTAKVLDGTVTLAELTAGGAKQFGCFDTPGDHVPFPATFPETGNWTKKLYAVSVAGVIPSTCVSWFQAEQACALSGKRLLTNQEWQRAAAGTPDPALDNKSTTCNIGSVPPFDPTKTGSRSACVSRWGVFDMVGNVAEWVADWSERASTCVNLPSTYGNDMSCISGPSGVHTPTALIRGGTWFDGAAAGVFSVNAFFSPSYRAVSVGFRCAR